MTTKEYLQKYKRITERLRQVENEIRVLEEEIDSISASDDPGTSGSTSNRTERMALRLVDKKIRYERIYAEAWDAREEVQGVIMMADDPIYGRLLYDRYILFMNWSQITDDLHYQDDTHVRGRLHSRALQSVEKFVPREENI